MNNNLTIISNDSLILVRQHNAIIEARYDLSALEKNIIHLLLAKLNDSDPVSKKYIISLTELIQKLEKFSRKCTREEFEMATKKLMRHVYEIYESNGDFLQVKLIDSAKHIRYTDNNDIVELKLAPDIRPYLFHLKNGYSEFELDIAFSLKSKYSQRIYELLAVYKDIGAMSITLERLKDCLKLIDPVTKEEQYKDWATFERQILDFSKKEIQKHTDLNFTYTLKKTGRKYTDITFHIKKQPVQGKLELGI